MAISGDLAPRGETLTVSIDEAVYRSGIGRAHLYRAMSAGELPYIQMGKSRLIEVEALRDYLRSLASR
jgi:excisionase family DNA binding protein